MYFADWNNEDMGRIMKSLLFCLMFACMGITHAADKPPFNYDGGKACVDGGTCVMTVVHGCFVAFEVSGKTGSAAHAIYDQMVAKERREPPQEAMVWSKLSKDQGLSCIHQISKDGDNYVCSVSRSLATSRHGIYGLNDQDFENMDNIPTKGKTDKSYHSKFEGCYDEAELDRKEPDIEDVPDIEERLRKINESNKK